MRRIATLTALAVPTLLAAGIGAPAALAADACPNEAVRIQQGSTHLPNCMAYEKITPDNKGGETPGIVQITEGGDGLTFMLNAGIEDAQSFVAARYRSMRSADGRWTTNALMPAFDGPRLPSIGDSAGDPQAVTSDLSRMVFSVAYPVNPNDQGMANVAGNVPTKDVYLREADGSFRWLVPDPSVPDTTSSNVFFGAASPDLDRVVLATTRQWDPRVTDSSVNHLYVWTPSGTQLVTVLPNGDLATGLPSGSTNDGTVMGGTQASADAHRVAFVDTGSGAPRVYVRFNADDPATAVTREVAVGPDGQPCGSAALRDLSADGRYVIFNCGTAILPGGPESATYIRDLDGGPGAVRLLGRIADVTGATADYSRIYGLDFDGGLVVSRDRGEAEPVVAGVQTPSQGRPEVQMSADGEYLAFTTENDLGLPGVDHSTLNGQQVYRYAAATDELVCVSCRQDGNDTEGLGALEAGPVGGGTGGGGAAKSGVGPVSTSGTVAFSSLTALVPQDTNGQADAYAWVDGRAVLLSGGQSPRASVAQGSSHDGSSIFFRTTDAMVPEDVDGGTYDLYVARANGGTLLPEPPTAPCTANCQAPAPGVPGLPNLSTPTFLGRGNLVEKTTEPEAAPARAKATLTVSSSIRGTRTSVRVKVSRAGSIRVSGVGLRQTTVQAKKAGTYRVTVRLSANGVKQQKQRGRVATRITARFTPKSGASVSARKSVTFTAKRGGR
ncbi:MAG: hypothetical protein WC558_10655 [Patulibacter sp.]